MAFNPNNPNSLFPYFPAIKVQNNGSNVDVRIPCGELNTAHSTNTTTYASGTTDTTIGTNVLSFLNSTLSATEKDNLVRSINIWKYVINGLSTLSTETPLTANDSSSIDFTTSGTAGHTLTGTVIVSPNAGNLLSNPGNGLYSDETANSVTTTSTINFTASGTKNRTISGSVKISANANNIISAQADGIYANVASVVIPQTMVIQASAAIAQGDALKVTGTAGSLLTMAPCVAQSEPVHAIATATINNGAQGAVTIHGVLNVKASGTTALGDKLGSTATSGTVAAVTETTLVVMLNTVTTPPTGAQAFAMATGRGVMALGAISGGQCSAYIF